MGSLESIISVQILTFCSFSVVFLFVFCRWLKWSYEYWTRRGVKQIPPRLFGHVKDSLMMKMCEAQLYDDLYRESEEEPAIGIYKILQPTLLIRSPFLAKQILVTQFDSFRDNDTYTIKSDSILSTHPFTTRGERWRQGRSVASPAFTPGKIKTRFPSIVEACKEMVECIRHNLDNRLEAKYLGGDFTTEVSTRTIFGVLSESFSKRDSVYRKYNFDAFDATWSGNLVYTLTTYFPRLCRFFNVRMTPSHVESLYENIIREIVTTREKLDTQGNDYLQYLIQLKKSEDIRMSVHDITRHTLSMLWDGYSTSSVVIGHCLDFLSKHPQVQDDLRMEIQQNIPTLDDIDYAKLESMPYLHAFMSEVLRMRTPIPVLHKVCTKKAQLEEEGRQYVLTPGDRIIIPIWSIHNDPHHHKNPEEFNPERFLHSDHHPAYMPFGLGPRACMGTKFGLAQTKACIVSLMKHFRVEQAHTIQKTSWDEKSGFFLLVKGGIWIKFHDLNNQN